MALITTTASLIRQYNAFTGLSALERSQSGIARAEVVYYNINDDFPAPGSGNNRTYTSGRIDLPKDFGYVLTDVYIQLAGSSADNIEAEAVGSVTLYPGGVLGPQINTTLQSVPSRQSSTPSTAIGDTQARRFNTFFPDGNSTNNSTINYFLASKPSAIIYPFAFQTYTTSPDPASQFEFSLGEAQSDGNAYVATCYLRFLQYDIDQSYNYVIQSPQLTR